MFSLDSLIAWLAGVDPLAAGLVSLVVLVLQRRASGKSFAPGELLASILALFRGGKPDAEKSLPVPPMRDPANPPTTNPIRADSERLVDLLLARVRERLRRRVTEANGDEQVIFQAYSQIVSTLDDAEAKAAQEV